MLEKLKANEKEHAKQKGDLNQLKERLSNLEEGAASKPIPQVQRSQSKSDGASAAPTTIFLPVVDTYQLQCVNRA